jgi:hypothetical protein
MITSRKPPVRSGAATATQLIWCGSDECDLLFEHLTEALLAGRSHVFDVLRVQTDDARGRRIQRHRVHPPIRRDLPAVTQTPSPSPRTARRVRPAVSSWQPRCSFCWIIRLTVLIRL